MEVGGNNRLKSCVDFPSSQACNSEQLVEDFTCVGLGLRYLAQEPDLSMLMRLRDVADEYAERARDLRDIMIGRSADPDALEEVGNDHLEPESSSNSVI